MHKCSYKKRYFPDKLKEADVSAIHKNDDKCQKTNYRPISVLLGMSKIFERIMNEQRNQHFAGILSPLPSGFRQGYNTQYALFRVIEIRKKHLDMSGTIGTILKDLSKAYDCIPHDLLIAKIDAYGLNRKALKLVYSYHKNRMQRVKTGSTFSSSTKISIGVPQGSVLGPLLFNIFINDLFFIEMESGICNFADDTKIYACDTSIEAVMIRIEGDVYKLMKWFTDNGMKANPSKFQIMFLGRKDMSKLCLNIGGNLIPSSKQVKLLGVNIDNSLKFEAHVKEICRKVNLKVNAFIRLRPFLGEQKSKLIFNSVIMFNFSYCPLIGFLIDSMQMRVYLTNEKIVKIKAHIQIALNNDPHVTIESVARILGLFVSSFPAVQYGKLHYRYLEMDKIEALRVHKGNYNSIMSISPKGKEDLQWWYHNIENSFCTIHPLTVDIVLYSDASLTGWGAALHNTSTGGQWSHLESLNHINFLELNAAYFALKSFRVALSSKHVKIMIDNTAAVCIINNMGTCHNYQCNDITMKIWEFCAQNNIWLTAAHLPGSTNLVADMESRKHSTKHTEWMLNPNVLSCALKQLNYVPVIDLFASRLNKQFNSYCSFRPDPDAKYIDAFSVSWSNEKFYCFPPFICILRTIQKIKRDHAKGILVVPDWPTQSWYPLLRSLFLQKPIYIQPSKTLLTLPSSPTATPPTIQKAETSYLSLVRKKLIDQDIPSNAIEIILSSWRAGTQNQYSSSLRKWVEFCDVRSINIVSPTVPQVLEFLTIIHENGLSYSSVNTTKSALSSILDLGTQTCLGQLPIVKRFMKGVFEWRPSLPKHKHIWDVKIVLDFFRQQCLPSALSLKDLSAKVAFLLCLVSGQRCQTIKLMSIDSMQVLEDQYIFFVNQPVKLE